MCREPCFSDCRAFMVCSRLIEAISCWSDVESESHCKVVAPCSITVVYIGNTTVDRRGVCVMDGVGSPSSLELCVAMLSGGASGVVWNVPWSRLLG